MRKEFHVMTIPGLGALSLRSRISGKDIRAFSFCRYRARPRNRISVGVASLIITTGMSLGELQEPPTISSQERAGIVTGHVYCGDTHQLARFASVIVQPLALLGSTGKEPRTEVESPTIADTDFDGKFTVSDLLPGSYLVLAWLPGYVSPFAQIKADSDKPEPVLKALETVLPRIEVKNNLVTTIDITLVRGAEVSGSVAYDDGSPAVGFQMNLLNPFGAENSGRTVKLSNSRVDFPGELGSTDDRGYFRLSGIPPGSYVLAATSPSGSSRGCGVASGSCKIMMVPPNTYFRIYSGNALRLKDAKAFSIVEGEQRNGVDLVLPLRHLHQVAGVVVAKTDGHLLKGGSVQLLYADDQSVAQRTRIIDDGTFVLNLVQDGAYLLKVRVAADRPSKNSAQTYLEQIMPMEISGNVTDLAIAIDSK
jgi:hypothetical protein